MSGNVGDVPLTERLERWCRLAKWMDMSAGIDLLELAFVEVEASRQRGQNRREYGMLLSGHVLGIHVGYATVKEKRFSDAVSFMTSCLIPLLAGESINWDMLSDDDEMQAEQDMWEYICWHCDAKLAMDVFVSLLTGPFTRCNKRLDLDRVKNHTTKNPQT